MRILSRRHQVSAHLIVSRAMGPVFFLTTNVDKHAEVAALLKRDAAVVVERRTATLPVPPSVVPREVARFRALAAFQVLAGPVFAEALGIELGGGMVSGASYRQAFEQLGGSPWLKRHDGVRGVAHAAVGFTADGVRASVFESAIPGSLRTVAHGRGNAAWERHWIPESHEQTVADLVDAAAEEGLRNASYLALARQLRGA